MLMHSLARCWHERMLSGWWKSSPKATDASLLLCNGDGNDNSGDDDAHHDINNTYTKVYYLIVKSFVTTSSEPNSK